ncbi:MAG: hypothetical protein NDI90_19440 [Nitrospira sp. BO4]|nr:hypothetical protein [Nitrospira sp. BO4]
MRNRIEWVAVVVAALVLLVGLILVSFLADNSKLQLTPHATPESGKGAR